MIADMATQGLLEQIDPSGIPNYGNIDPKYQSQYFDEDNLYTIPYTFTVP
jgi:spermidine/putrescine transport system substrate-binding protein